MRNNKMKVYMLLLLVLAFSGSILLSVGITQARYVNVVTAPAVIQAPEDGVTSNCLVPAEEPARTVLLGQLDYEESILVPFWLQSSDADAVQKLDWGIVEAKYDDYLDICVFSGYTQLKADEKLELIEDIRLDLLLRLEPTQKAQTTYHEELKLNVHVTWGEELWGTFQVVLPEVKAPETEPVTEPMTEYVPESTTEPATEEVTESATEETTEPATEETTESATEGTTEPATEDTTEPATEDTTESATGESTEPATDAATVSVTEQATEYVTEAATEMETESIAEENTEPETEPPVVIPTEMIVEPIAEVIPDPEDYLNNLEIQMDLIKLKAIAGVNPKVDQLPVMIELDANITSIRFGIQLEYGDLEVFVPFPDYTMFSLDGGASYYMVYGEVIPEFKLSGVTSIPLLLDFSYAELDEILTVVETDGKEYEKFILAMDAYTGSKLRKHCEAAVLPVTQESGQATVKSSNKNSASVDDDADMEYPGLVLTQDDMLELFFPIEWKDADLDYSVELLTLTEDQTLEYIPVTLKKDSLNVTYYIDEYAHKLVVRMGQKFAQPGTYRINTTWSYEDVCYADTQTIFFVNYFAKSDDGLSSKEVPNDE